MQRAFGDLLGGKIGGPEAQHVGDGDRAVAGAEDVADHAADPGVGAAEGLDRRRVVVRLRLQRQRGAVEERDDPGVAGERRAHELGADPLGDVAQLAQQRCDRPAVDRDRGSERLVGAMLAPRLGERLQLDVGGFTAEPGEVVADGPQLGEVEGHRAFGVDRKEAVVIEGADGDRLGARDVVAAGMEDGVDARRRPPFDHGVGDHAAQQGVDRDGVTAGRELDAPAGRRRRNRHLELGGGVDDGAGSGVGDARVERDLEGVFGRGRVVPRRRLQ